jgi:hypothetical protein
MHAPASATVYQILYVSRLVADCRYDEFTAICRVARTRNPQRQTTGVLLFDGQRFCQLLQGPQAALLELMGEIERDRRHEALVTLHEGHVEPQTIERTWAAGFCESDELDLYEGPDGARGVAALLAFYNIVSRAELSG